VNPEARKKWAKTLSKRKNTLSFADLDQLQPEKFGAATTYPNNSNTAYWHRSPSAHAITAALLSNSNRPIWATLINCMELLHDR